MTADVAAEVNGLAVATDAQAAVENQVRATFSDAGVAVTISYPPAARGEPASAGRGVAEEILGTFRAATP